MRRTRRLLLLAAAAGCAVVSSGAAAGPAGAACVPPTRPAAACKMEVTDFRAIPTKDAPIDWGASDGNPNTAPRTAGTFDDYDPGHDPDDSAFDRPEFRAGAHPFLNLFVRFCDPDPTDHATGGQQQGCADRQLNARLRDLKLDLPAGMIGNPTAAPACPQALITLGTPCASSLVGYTFSYVQNGGGSAAQTAPTGIYNVQTFGMEPARLSTGTIVAALPGPYPILVSAAQGADGDVTISSLTPDLPKIWSNGTDAVKVVEQQIVLFQRTPASWGGYGNPPPVPAPDAKPFMVNPTSCGPQKFRISVSSWDDADLSQASGESSFTTTGCDNPATRPALDRPASDPLGEDKAAVTIGPDAARGGTDQAGQPTAYTIGLHLPDTEASEIHGSHLKSAEVVLPQGVTLAAGAGSGLEGCTAGQFGLTDPQAPVACPGGSKVGSVQVQSPVLAEPLSGGLYFGQPSAPGPATASNPWPLYLAIEGSGVRVKLAGEVTVDQATGQITTLFDRNPQVPFTDLRIELLGGDRAVLQNPSDCGPHVGGAQLKGWSGDEVTLAPEVSVTGCNDSPGFTPSVAAHSDDDSAGASSPSHLEVNRPDGDSRIRKLSLALPPGLVGSLTAAPLCPAADAQAGTCSDASKVGSIKTAVGVGSALVNVTGSLFIAEKTAPDEVASLSAVIPAKIGPIDLGKVVVVNHVHLRQSDGGLTAETDEIPSALGGIPLYVKQIRIDVDRPGFLTNPTGCNPRTLSGNFDSEHGQSANASVSLTATNCDRLPFNPRLRLVAEGETKRFGHPGLRAIVSQSRGEANIARAIVKLPDILRPELPNIQKNLCRTAQLEAGACPAPSQVGTATARTPLLPQPLTGPVFLVQDPNPIDPLPRLVVPLAGMASIELRARNTIEGVRTVNTFDSIPDVPVSSFELAIKGGATGILKSFRDLCGEVSRADASFFGQNGATPTSRPALEAPGCDSVSSSAIKTRSVRMSRKGVVAIKVQCARSSCEGDLAIRSQAKAPRMLGRKRFKARADKVTTVKVQLDRRTRRQVLARKRLAARTVLTVGTSEVASTLTIKAAKTKRKHRR